MSKNTVLHRVVPVVAALVLGGGIGAAMRYFARRSRAHTERVRVGRFSVYDRD